MAVIEWIRFLFGALFLLCGLLIFLIEMVGVFRFRYVRYARHCELVDWTDTFQRTEFYIFKIVLHHCFSVVFLSDLVPSDSAAGGCDG